MGSWPADYNGSWTLASSVSRSGIGLHSGQQCDVSLFPSEQEGFYVRWLNQTSAPIRLDPSQVRDSQLCTTLDFGDRQLSTVEHLLAALAGCGVSHVEVEVTGGYEYDDRLRGKISNELSTSLRLSIDLTLLSPGQLGRTEGKTRRLIREYNV